MQAFHTLQRTVTQSVTNLLNKVPNPVTVVKNTEWKQLASQTALKIKEFSKEIFKVISYSFLIKLSPYMFVIGLTLGLAYPKETHAATNRVYEGIYGGKVSDKIIIAGAALLGMPVVTFQIGSALIAAEFGALVSTGQAAPVNPVSNAVGVANA